MQNNLSSVLGTLNIDRKMSVSNANLEEAVLLSVASPTGVPVPPATRVAACELPVARNQTAKPLDSNQISNWPMLTIFTPNSCRRRRSGYREMWPNTDSPVRRAACHQKMKGTTKGPFPQSRPGCNGGLAPSIRRQLGTLWAIKSMGPLRRGRLQRPGLTRFGRAPTADMTRHGRHRFCPLLAQLLLLAKRTTRQTSRGPFPHISPSGDHRGY